MNEPRPRISLGRLLLLSVSLALLMILFSRPLKGLASRISTRPPHFRIVLVPWNWLLWLLYCEADLSEVPDASRATWLEILLISVSTVAMVITTAVVFIVLFNAFCSLWNRFTLPDTSEYQPVEEEENVRGGPRDQPVEQQEVL